MKLGARSTPAPVADDRPPAPATGAITSEALGISLGALIPENAIVVDEAVTTGRGFFAPTRAAAPHDWLSNMGGSIGMGMPLATGAAVACPDRKVICLEGDGSGMYTLQALWTQAREGLDVTTLLFSNRSYAILRGELANVGAGNPGPQGARHARSRPPRPRLGGPRALDGRPRGAGHDDGGLQRPPRRGHRHARPLFWSRSCFKWRRARPRGDHPGSCYGSCIVRDRAPITFASAAQAACTGVVAGGPGQCASLPPDRRARSRSPFSAMRAF